MRSVGSAMLNRLSCLLKGKTEKEQTVVLEQSKTTDPATVREILLIFFKETMSEPGQRDAISYLCFNFLGIYEADFINPDVLYVRERKKILE